ncbi:MAG: hypothetical protein A3F09_01620 [Chlamydiae bacterium RIFCSPHIGHO2_12_FULL_49_11]|nr:MAG: hypothetical protein A3F09_01620 [Chlamydiae bacterium RIFCSPHIGHO2_12_FULL_49_11]
MPPNPLRFLENQLFDYWDIPVVVILFFFELLLSADNAVIIAQFVRHVDPKKQNLALYTGVASSFFLRLIALLFAVYLMLIRWVLAFAGGYLVFLAVRTVFFPKEEKQPGHYDSLLKTIFWIELYDIVFAIDSILAAYGLAAIYYPYSILPHKLWVMYVGGIFSILTIRFLSLKIMRFIDRHPRLERIAFYLVGWIGVKLVAEAFVTYWNFPMLKEFLDFFFWLGSAILVLIGFITVRKRHG